MRAEDSGDDCCAEFVGDGALGVAGGGYEELGRVRLALEYGSEKRKRGVRERKGLRGDREKAYLVLDVDEVLGVGDGVDVGVGNGVLSRQTRRPLRSTNTTLETEHTRSL